MTQPPNPAQPSQPHAGAVVLIETRTGFEAETIAAALNARGIVARTADTASAAVLGGTSVVKAKVLVAAEVQTLARQVLDEIRAETSEIDWDEIDIGPEEEATRFHAARRGRRVLWTLCVILVPVGLAVFALGNNRSDTVLQSIGGTVMLSALAIAIGLTILVGERVDPGD